MTTPSLRDAIAEAPCLVVPKADWPCSFEQDYLKHPECAEAAARQWMADWLRSDEGVKDVLATVMQQHLGAAHPEGWVICCHVAPESYELSGGLPLGDYEDTELIYEGPVYHRQHVAVVAQGALADALTKEANDGP